MRSVDNVLSEIDGAIKDFGAKEIHIADDAFNVNKKRTLEICEAIRAREYGVNFEFLNGLRADTLDDDMLDAFRSIGIRNVGFGVESANEGILKNVKKNIMPHTVEKAVAIARKKGFKTWAFFMVGLPGENKDTIKETISFARRMDPDFAKFLIFKPFPGSDIYNDIKDEGLIDDFDPADYGVYTPPVHHLKSMSAAEMIKWQKRAFRAFYFRPSKIWSHLRRQHSISQLKLSLRGLAFVIFNAFKSEKRSALHKKSPEVLI
jgi:anaerobic magnesium-protoporphyrin IX monomethyl ester cyclase